MSHVTSTDNPKNRKSTEKTVYCLTSWFILLANQSRDCGQKVRACLNEVVFYRSTSLPIKYLPFIPLQSEFEQTSASGSEASLIAERITSKQITRTFPPIINTHYFIISITSKWKFIDWILSGVEWCNGTCLCVFNTFLPSLHKHPKGLESCLL